MSFHHSVPCVMTNTDQFFIRICDCGVVHLNFGCTVVNVSAEAAIAIFESLKEVTRELRSRLDLKPASKIEEKGPTLDNIIYGKFEQKVGKSPT